MKDNKALWKELIATKEGTTLKDWFDEGVRCLIVRGPGSLCAYLGVPIDHPLAGHDYDNVPIECHGGLTFAGAGDDTYRPKGWYWYGWDYAHSGDYCFYYDTVISAGLSRMGDTKWGVKEVERDMSGSIYDFRKLIRLIEATSKTKL